MKRIIFFLLLLSSQSLWAATGLSLGTYMPHMGQLQNNREGGTDFLAINPSFSVHQRFALWNPQFYFHPEVGISFYTGLEEEYSKRTIFLLYDFGWSYNAQLSFKAGLGTFITRISGDGEELNRNNGSSTSTYYAPSDSASTYNTTWNLGAEYRFTKAHAVRFETLIFQPLSGDDRSLSALLTYNFYWEGIFSGGGGGG